MGAAINMPPVRKASGLLVRRFPNVPVEATDIIASNSPIYGSQAIVLLVAAEVLVRQKRPLRLRYRTKKNGKTTTAQYKLLPHTVELINRLTPVYGSKGKVIEACSMVIERVLSK